MEAVGEGSVLAFKGFRTQVCMLEHLLGDFQGFKSPFHVAVTGYLLCGVSPACLGPCAMEAGTDTKGAWCRCGGILAVAQTPAQQLEQGPWGRWG